MSCPAAGVEPGRRVDDRTGVVQAGLGQRDAVSRVAQQQFPGVGLEPANRLTDGGLAHPPQVRGGAERAGAGTATNARRPANALREHIKERKQIDRASELKARCDAHARACRATSRCSPTSPPNGAGRSVRGHPSNSVPGSTPSKATGYIPCFTSARLPDYDGRAVRA